MEKFNLICQWKRNPDGKLHYHVPCMLTTKKDVKSIDNSSVPAPVYLTFNTEYVPSGLFSRLVVLFWKWASEMSSVNCKITLRKLRGECHWLFFHGMGFCVLNVIYVKEKLILTVFVTGTKNKDVLILTVLTTYLCKQIYAVRNPLMILLFYLGKALNLGFR
ncbi:hypothetical protein OS493_018331 [Desmophyllum pertusum]|uniref:Uncharacterized protein n=1 Tax=Desmophyllum pertusum TaxID=174260 RepID=A0A9W9YC05_9CNID|nr:hypothetical protein OS493_018331 [Desmophyllum pertusum]